MSKSWADLTDRARGVAIAVAIGVPVRPYEERRDHQWLDNPDNYPYVTDDGERLIYWRAPNEDGFDWGPTSNHAAARLVEDEIERRGASYTYVRELRKLLPIPQSMHANSDTHVFMFLRATPEQRCEAAWRALGNT